VKQFGNRNGETCFAVKKNQQNFKNVEMIAGLELWWMFVFLGRA
jgi:hypothetical protein